MSHFTNKTLNITSRVHSTNVSVREEVISQQRCVRESLNNTVHEACVTKVYQTSQTYKYTHKLYTESSKKCHPFTSVIF